MAGRPFQPGHSGNPGGRAKIATAIRAAGYDPDDLRKEVIEQLVNGMRTLDPAGPRSAKSWQFCVDRLDVRLHGPIREVVNADDKPEMTPEEERAECVLIAREVFATLSADERMKLLENTMGGETVQ